MAKRASSLLMGIFLCTAAYVWADPASSSASPKSGWFVDSIGASEYISHFQTSNGNAVTLPELVLRGSAQLGSPRWHLSLRHFRGTSPRNSQNFQASVGDFEGRVEYRLDNPHAALRGDFFTKNVTAWLSWKIWSSTEYIGNQTIQERDEGLGLGISRSPSEKGLSYFYEASVYPSVHTSLSDQKNAYTASTGLAFNVTDSISLHTGYRLQTLRTGDLPNQRAQEQGIIFGFKARF